jgi:toxin ParE1/3/4
MDLTDVLQYTLETWGKAQMHAYGEVLDKALSTLQEYPWIGHPRPEISREHRIFPAGRHLIVYRVTEAAIYISRILHERMDIRRHAE